MGVRSVSAVADLKSGQIQKAASLRPFGKHQRPIAPKRLVSALTRLVRASVSALTRLETRIGLADHEDLATAADDLAVAVTSLRRLEGGQDLHGKPRNTVGNPDRNPDQNGMGTNQPRILARHSPRYQALASPNRAGRLE